MQVKAEESVVSESPGSGFLSLINRPVNSAARCWLSAAEPPLPQNITFPPDLIVVAQTFAALLTFKSSDVSLLNRLMCSFKLYKKRLMIVVFVRVL